MTRLVTASSLPALSQSGLVGAGHNMWRLAFSLSVLSSVRALTIQSNGVLDEKNDAVVLEGQNVFSFYINFNQSVVDILSISQFSSKNFFNCSS